jgi:hypothetical protein
MLAVLLAAVGCDTHGTVGIIARNTADVRVLNASATSIDVLTDQTIDPGNGDIVFGTSSQCMTVDITSHGLSVRPAGIRTTTTPLPSFASNERYVVTVTGTGGAYSVISFRDSYTPATGKAAVRLINVSGSTNGVDIYVTDPGVTLGTASASNVLTGTASAYFDVPITAQQIRLTSTGSSLVAFDLGSVTIPVGGKALVVLAPPATGSTTARPFVFQIASAGSC